MRGNQDLCAMALTKVRTWVAALLLCLGATTAPAQSAAGDSVQALRERYAALQEPLRNNPFGRALHLDSVQNSGDLRGDIHAVVEHPFATLGAALGKAETWCDVLILHLNVKQCRVVPDAAAITLVVHIGRKFDQPIDEAYRVEFAFRQVAATPEYLHASLRADSGPMGTRDYSIALKAVPLDEGRSFMHLSYSYGYGMAARLALQAYLSTLGSGKMGFSVIDKRPDGTPVYVGSVRGVVERNTMRYYLAIDSYLGALAVPPAQQVEKRLRDWFTATERYALQLHEMSEAEYLDMKRKEVARRAAPG
ncbi:MAG: hypothetical protein JHC40_10545 [Burkholderiales bacterium]|jgi:hypothetical protein|nr:hypothetical protein [Burkholderiales bacterium]